MEWNPDIFPAMPHYKAPALLGFIITSILFGCSIMSAVNYMQFSFHADRTGTRLLVCASAIGAAASMTFSVIAAVRHFGFRFGLRPTVEDAKWDSAAYLLGGISHVLVAGFFAHRAWSLFNRSVYLGTVLSILILATLVSALGATISGMTDGAGVRSQTEDVFNYILVISQVVGDLLISILIITKLHRSKTGWKRTDSTIRKLTIIGIETQAPPALVAIAFVITYTGAPYVSYILAFAFIPQLYYLCFFAALNARYTISSRMASEASVLKIDDVRSRRPLPAAISVTTETYTHADGGADYDIQMKRPRQRGAGKRGDSDESLQEDLEETRDLNTSEIRLV